MRYPFESKEAKELNIKIFETLYYGALEASCELAAEKSIYETYQGSPVSKGVSNILLAKHPICVLQFYNNLVFFRFCNMICGMLSRQIYGIGMN